MGTHCTRKHLVSLDVLATHVGRRANVEEYCKTLNEVDKNMQDTKQKFYISGITAGMDAQVEVKPLSLSLVEARDCLEEMT